MQWPHDLPPEQEMDSLLSQTKMRVFMHKGAGFHGSLLCAHELIWDFECPTAWCDGERIGLNPYFFYELNEDARVALVVHELRHSAHDHFDRFKDTESEEHALWNQAGDYIINNDLDHMGFDVHGLNIRGINICLDHQYDGMTTEQVYDALSQNPRKKPPSDMDGDIRPSPDGGDNGGAGTGQAKKLERIKKVVQARTASILAGDEAGTIPGEIEVMIDKFLNPQLPWEQLLSRWLTEMSEDDYSYRRPNRRYEEEILPSLIGENGLDHLMYFMDISGSVTDEQITQFNTEAKFIHDEIHPKKMTIVTFDTKIRDVYEFEQDDDYNGIKVVGRGGTSLKCVHDMVKEKQPTAAVIFTDLYCAPMQDPNVPVLWTVVDNPNAKVNFGTLVHFE